MIEDIQDFYRISADLLTAGQPTADQLAEIFAAGCQVVINLGMPDSPDALEDEDSWVRQLGMEYISIPVIWRAPTRADLDAFFSALDRCQGKKVFVHCARNMRASAFVYLYRVLRLNEPPEKCLEDLLTLWEPDPLWQSFIDKAAG